MTQEKILRGELPSIRLLIVWPEYIGSTAARKAVDAKFDPL
jgi:hypothetical protein